MSQQLQTESSEKAKQQILRREAHPVSAPSFHGGLHPMLQLQRAIGNQQVAQLIQAKRLSPQGKILGLQRKLTVGAAGDQYEQEADRVAQQVVNTPDAIATASAEQIPSFGNVRNQIVQTKQLKPLAGSFEAGADVETQVNQSKGSGSPLPDSVRAYMEPRFGIDFSDVRVHTGSNAIQMNRDISAQAFTHGTDIYFGAGHSPTNLELTAHELTHVVQQTGGASLQTKKLEEASATNTDLSFQRTCAACATGGPPCVNCAAEKGAALQRQATPQIQRRTECREDEETQQTICEEVPDNTLEEPLPAEVDQWPEAQQPVESQQPADQSESASTPTPSIENLPGTDYQSCIDQTDEDTAKLQDTINKACSIKGAAYAGIGTAGGALFGPVGAGIGAIAGMIYGANDYGSCVEEHNAEARAGSKRQKKQCAEKFGRR